MLPVNVEPETVSYPAIETPFNVQEVALIQFHEIVEVSGGTTALGVAEIVQDGAPAPALQSASLVHVFEPPPESTRHALFWQPKWLPDPPPPPPQDASLQVSGPLPTAFTHAFCTASQTPCVAPLPGGPPPHSASFEQRFTPAPETDVQVLLTHSEWVAGGGGAVTRTVAEPDCVGSCTLVAVMVAVVGAPGAVYTPLELTEPPPDTDQVTAGL